MKLSRFSLRQIVAPGLQRAILRGGPADGTTQIIYETDDKVTVPVLRGKVITWPEYGEGSGVDIWEYQRTDKREDNQVVFT